MLVFQIALSVCRPEDLDVHVLGYKWPLIFASIYKALKGAQPCTTILETAPVRDKDGSRSRQSPLFLAGP